MRLAERYGGRWRLGESLGRVRHAITHRRFDIEAFAGRLEAGDSVAESRKAGWFSPEELQALPTSSLVAKVLDLKP